MNLTSFLSSKKAKGLLSTQASIVTIVVAALWITQADPEKLQAVSELVKWSCGAIAAAGAAYIGGQAAVDVKSALPPKQ